MIKKNRTICDDWNIADLSLAHQWSDTSSNDAGKAAYIKGQTYRLILGCLTLSFIALTAQSLHAQPNMFSFLIQALCKKPQHSLQGTECR